MYIGLLDTLCFNSFRIWKKGGWKQQEKSYVKATQTDEGKNGEFQGEAPWLLTLPYSLKYL